MPKSDGYGNLIPMNRRTKEEQSAIATQGGKASGESRRRRKNTQEIVRMILDRQITEAEGAERLEALGLPTTWSTKAHVAVMQRAENGDVEAMRYLRDSAGDKPRDALEVGNLDGQPLATIDLSTMTDEQLRAMIALRAEDEPQ